MRIGDVSSVQGDTVMASVLPAAAPGLTFSRGHAYFVGQVGAYVRIPLGLIDVFAIVVQVGSSLVGDHPESETVPGRPWMKLELLGEAHRDGSFDRGISRYPSISDPVLLVTASDLNRIYDVGAGIKSIQLGHISNAPHLPARIDVSALVNRHSAVVGSTGSGKSTTVSSLLAALSEKTRFPSARILIIDVHGEYKQAFGTRATCFRVDATENRNHDTATEQMYLPYWALPFEDFLHLALGEVDENSAVVIQSLVLDMKREYVQTEDDLGLDLNNITVDTPIPFSVRKLWMTLHELQFATHSEPSTGQTHETIAYALTPDGEQVRGDIESVSPPSYRPISTSGPDRVYLSQASVNARRQTNSLGAKLRDPRYDFLFRPGRWDVPLRGRVQCDLGDFLALWLGNATPIVIADLSGVPNAVLQRVTSVLLRLLYESLVWARNLSEGGRERPLLVVLEEAHRYLGDGTQGAGEIVDRIVKEGRKFGVGVMIVSQRPSDIRPSVLSQLGSFFVMRMTNATDRGIVRSTLPDNMAGLFDAVPVLRTGEALVTGEVVKLPTRVTVQSRESERPDSADPKVIGRELPGGWDVARAPQDYADVALAWRRLTPISSKVIRELTSMVDDRNM
ncbi:conserved hypothetical protein [Clavibacter nebraskensis NCPPB 2581]|nr:conserved hypothetical protein [Clavibacter nebraskensis NCPPB 2581]